MTPEELLHLFGPFLPTDRFRALLRDTPLPASTQGAALLVDVSGFIPLTTGLVKEFGPRRASEELKRRLNPMFEAIAGQVFNHGGSVLHFSGDGFLAWFDDQQFGLPNADPAVPAALRAVAAGLDMQVIMPLFRGMRVRVAIGTGTAYRWVVGRSQHGLNDLLSGPAVNATVHAAAFAEPGQVLIDRAALPLLMDENVTVELPDNGYVLVKSIPAATANAARAHRWAAWEIGTNAQSALDAVRPFVGSALREQVENGFGNFLGELRYALPMFIKLSRLPQEGGARDALDARVQAVQDVLADTGGRLVSVEVGDKGSVIFAVFGAPITYGDDAERALTAALTLRDWGIQHGMVIAQQIGISRGLLYAGVIGGEVRHEYSAIGDETNLAARLMSSAEPGQILVTSRVRGEASQRVLFYDLAPIFVKGKDEPIAISEPIALQTRLSRHIQSGELIGRATEVGRMQKLLKAVSVGLPRILRIEGEAGIGKSRLKTELTTLATEISFRAIGGDCVSTGRSTAYLPWREVMSVLLDLPPKAPPEANIAYLTGVLREANAEWLVRLPLLGELLQLPIPDSSTTAALQGRARRQALFALVTDLVLHFARRQPLALLFEDVQWIDELSGALTLELARRLSVDPASVLLTLIHRPFIDTDHALELAQNVTSLPMHALISLGELSRSDVDLLIEDYLGAHVPLELGQFVYEKAQGNPFFVQEVLDTLEETGTIKILGSTLFIERALDEADLPSTVQGLVQARIDRLSETDKLVLKVASVIGTQFQVRVLAESMPIQIKPDELITRLRTLENRDFTYSEPTDSGSVYLFKHAIIQEVTYQSLPFAQRRQLHQVVGTAIESLYPDSIERLAYHFECSGDYKRAWPYLLAAAQKADHEYANQAALDYLDQALALATTSVERFSLFRRRLNILLRIGNIERAETELSAINELAISGSRRDWIPMVQVLRANYFLQTSRWSDALNEARAAVALAQAVGNDELAWDGYMLMVDAYRSLDDSASVRVVMPSMKNLVERLNDPRKRISLIFQELEDLYREQPQAALEGALAALQQAETLNDPVLEADGWSTLATFYSRDNNRPAALNAYKRQIGLLRQIGNRRGEGHTLNSIGITLTSLGQFSEGNANLLNAYKILHQIGERWGESTSLTFLGVIASHRRAYDEALAYMNRGLVIVRDLNARSDIALTLYHMGNTYLAKGERHEAETAYLEALGLYYLLEFQTQIAEVSAGLAEIELLYGNIDIAQRHIEAILPSLEQLRINDMQQPGLAYWRAIQVMDRVGQVEIAGRLWAAFRRHSDATLEKLDDPKWRDAYMTNIWYHRALLDVDFNPTLQSK